MHANKAKVNKKTATNQVIKYNKNESNNPTPKSATHKRKQSHTKQQKQTPNTNSTNNQTKTNKK